MNNRFIQLKSRNAMYSGTSNYDHLTRTLTITVTLIQAQTVSYSKKLGNSNLVTESLC